MCERFQDGIYFVDLAPVTDPARVLATIAQVCGVREAAGRTLGDGLATFFAGQQTLLLLDNFEQLLAGAREVAELMAAAPDVRLLVTSRALLRIRAEHEVPISPLSATPAMTLFAGRAQFARPGLELTRDDTGTVLEICRRLDGFPLAIELAAARIKLLTPERLLARLEQRLPTLTGGLRDLPERQQTPRDAVAWSRDLLTPEQQILFRRLAVFVAGCTFEAAEAVGNLDGSIDILNDLTALVDLSLVRRDDTGEEPRFRMLESIREFGQDQLASSSEEPIVREAHSAWCLALVEESEPHLVGPGQECWLDRLESEHDNIRAALGRLAERRSGEASLRLVAAAYPFSFMRGYFREGLSWIERALESGDLARTDTRARALVGAGTLAAFRDEFALTVAWCEEALDVAREVGNAIVIGDALTVLGIADGYQGDFARALERYDEALGYYRELGHFVLESLTLSNLAFASSGFGDEIRAIQMAEDSLRLQRQLGRQWGAIISLVTFGAIAHNRGGGCALNHVVSRGPGSGMGTTGSEADPVASSGSCDHRGVPPATHRAARLFGAAQRPREKIGARGTVDEYQRRDSALAAVRRELTEEAFGAEYAVGESVSLEAIVAGAIAVSAAAESIGSHEGN